MSQQFGTARPHGRPIPLPLTLSNGGEEELWVAGFSVVGIVCAHVYDDHVGRGKGEMNDD